MNGPNPRSTHVWLVVGARLALEDVDLTSRSGSLAPATGAAFQELETG